MKTIAEKLRQHAEYLSMFWHQSKLQDDLIAAANELDRLKAALVQISSDTKLDIHAAIAIAKKTTNQRKEP